MNETMHVNAGNTGRSWSFLRIAAWTAAAVLLMVPLIAMQFTNEVNWSPFDFVIFGGLLFGTGVAFEIATRNAANTIYKIAFAGALLAAFLLIMINGAVGIIGNEGNTANLMFVGVLAVAFVGSLISRFQANGMSKAMFGAAIVHVLIAVIALAAGWGANAPIWPWDIVGATGMFVVLWMASGLLFRKAVQ